MSDAIYNDNDPYNVDWLTALSRAGYIARGDVDGRSVDELRTVDFDRYRQCHFFAGVGLWSYALRLAGWPDARSVWTGSCPCQPWSIAGRHRRDTDERDLWPAWLRIIAKHKPATIFGEQVASPDGRKWLSRLRADLERLGYRVGAADLCAASIGAPQIRQRLWWVADTHDARREGRERQGQQDQARQIWPAARCELVRPTRGPWPPGPNQVGTIPLFADGRSNRMGKMRAYGNAIVPQVAAEFIAAADEAMSTP